ncbi:UPF0481 protein [Salix suchowensis]|nr:UPF0481 protein [Salix suchowensis]
MAKDISHKLYTAVRLMSFQQNDSESECCIFRVPKPLRDVNLKAYAPLLISIGPFHRENKLLAMEKEKWKYFKTLTERDGMDEKKMCEIAIIIKNKEERLRRCYSEKFKLLESSDFVEMILLDAVFIIQFFLESYDNTVPKHFDPRMTFDIREDLMLLENQIPLFIIKDIYDRVNPRSQDAKAIPFLDLATCYFGKYSFLKKIERSRHFTDLLRNLMLNRAIERSYSFDPVKLKYTAIMLHKAGVRFQATRDKCLVNIIFDKGVLKIPQVEVDHNFERLVRNIMALEQCLYKREAYICSYIKFMDHLIDSAEDVGLLVENGIIVRRLGDDAAVSKMINNLCVNIDTHTCFGDISQKLNDHYKSPFNRAIANLVLGYFPNIWIGTGTVAAAILLILTFIQTIQPFFIYGRTQYN